MVYSEVQPLTARNLSRPHFQNQDNRLIQGYLREQKSRLKALAPFEDIVDVPNHQVDSPAIPGGGFSSPILRPRVERIKHNSGSTATKSPNARTVSKWSRQEQSQPDDVGDQLSRLEARRTNKEMRRQIMKGKVSSKEKKSSENTIPKLENCFELSLSEKFSAPNIRGGRLTLRPNTVPGFFSKGKLSVNVRTGERGVRVLPGNLRRKKTSNKQPTERITVTPFFDVSSSQVVGVGGKKQNGPDATQITQITEALNHEEYPCQTNVSTPINDNRKVVVDVRSSSPAVSGALRERSEVWDIELDMLLPSDASSVQYNGKTVDEPRPAENLKLFSPLLPTNVQHSFPDACSHSSDNFSGTKSSIPAERTTREVFGTNTFCWMPYPPRQTKLENKDTRKSEDYIEFHWPEERVPNNLGLNLIEDSDALNEDYVLPDVQVETETDQYELLGCQPELNERNYCGRYDNPWNEFGTENIGEDLILNEEQALRPYSASYNNVDDTILNVGTGDEFDIDNDSEWEMTWSSPVPTDLGAGWIAIPARSALLETFSETTWCPEKEIKGKLRNHWQPQRY